MNLSKSKYILGKRCPKNLWLYCYKPEEQEEVNNDNLLENGNKVGEFARHLFGDNYILINYNEDKSIMINETNKYLLNKPNIICEASFAYDNNYCSIDILKNDEDGVVIYEVKSSSEIKEIYIDDIAYQTWVLEKCGLKVKKSCLVYINNNYIKNGDLDINQYFKIEDVSEKIDLDEVEKEIIKLKSIINLNEEPDVDISMNCHNGKKVSYDCPFFKYCTKQLPKPNVFDIGWGMHFSKKLEMYYDGKVSFEDVLKTGKLNSKVKTQIEYTLNNLSPKIDKNNIKDLFATFTYPLYFLDFEAYQDVIPTIDGTKPNQQLCFQYSLHYYLEENGELYHKEFLSDDYNGNPMYELCKQLCKDIPIDSCVLVYSKSFEIPRLKEMAKLFPEFRDHLLNIADNIKDLLIPFSNQDYYVREMGGSSSIKKVLPALFPNDPSLDYHNLEQVHKGDEASSAYLKLKNLSKDEQVILRKNLLKYCCLDTYAMVKIYEKLKDSI